MKVEVNGAPARSKHVKSTDKRKAIIQAAFRRLVPGATKITLMRELADGAGFIAHCLKSNGFGSFDSLGYHQFTTKELGL